MRQSPSGTVIDAGWSAPGGWMAAKRALEGLMGGRGQVSLAHRRMENGMQLPVVEVFADDPLALAQAFRPDGTVLFDLSPEAAAARRAARSGGDDRFERESAEFFARVREAYLDRAQRNPERFLIVNAESSADEIEREIAEWVESLVGRKGEKA